MEEFTTGAEAEAEPSAGLPRMLNKHALHARLAPEMSKRGFGKWLYDATANGSFPKALRFGERNRRWREDEVLAWLERRPRECSPEVQRSLRRAQAARKAKQQGRPAASAARSRRTDRAGLA